nr:uncharacterized protein CTRU02_12534 [Colletotrichum truncatum]KAF6784546.1 hypothetical protein CTRU02_12534 [Colletotrichum truncatum]
MRAPMAPISAWFRGYPPNGPVLQLKISRALGCANDPTLPNVRRLSEPTRPLTSPHSACVFTVRSAERYLSQTASTYGWLAVLSGVRTISWLQPTFSRASCARNPSQTASRPLFGSPGDVDVQLEAVEGKLAETPF